MSNAGKMSSFTKKRIFADVRELKQDASDQYTAEPLEDNLFEWHFTVRGPKGTDFEGGFYHGRILLPIDYPFKPPNIVFLTPNGRFEAGKKICLSISAHHPEEWQAAWGVRLILEALISFFPTEGGGAVGSLDWSPAERRRLAVASRNCRCPKCGLLSDLVPPEREAAEDTDKTRASGGNAGANGGGSSASADEKSTSNKYATAIAQLHQHAAPSTPTAAAAKSEKGQSRDSRAAAEEDEGSLGTPKGTTGGGSGGGSSSSSAGTMPPREAEARSGAPSASTSSSMRAGAADAGNGSAQGSMPARPAQGLSPLQLPTDPNPLGNKTSPRVEHSSGAASGGSNVTSVASAGLGAGAGSGGGNVRQRHGAAQASPRAERGAADSGGAVSADRCGNASPTENGLDALLLLAWALGIAAVGLIGRKALRIFMLRFFDVPINW